MFSHLNIPYVVNVLINCIKVKYVIDAKELKKMDVYIVINVKENIEKKRLTKLNYLKLKKNYFTLITNF